MPELPEVETVRRDVDARYVGDRLDRLTVTGARTVRRHSAQLLAKLEGRALTRTRRHGKYLLLEWEGGECLVVHLRMSGQLLAAKGTGAGAPQGGPPGTAAPEPPHTHAVFGFRREGELRFVDPRTFGELYLPSGLAMPGTVPAASPARSPRQGVVAWAGRAELPAGMAHLGPDALAVTPTYLGAVARGRRLAVKALLADQVALAGIGNIYSDEICWHARVYPATPAGQLKPAQVERLVTSIGEVLGDAIAARGSTLADEQYCDIYGRPGSYQLQHGVYGRSTCLRCGSGTERVRSGPRLAYFCPRCQRPPRRPR